MDNDDQCDDERILGSGGDDEQMMVLFLEIRCDVGLGCIFKNLSVIKL